MVIPVLLIVPERVYAVPSSSVRVFSPSSMPAIASLRLAVSPSAAEDSSLKRTAAPATIMNIARTATRSFPVFVLFTFAIIGA
jgi:hypothetical protein